MTESEWLASLKVGDDVLIKSNRVRSRGKVGRLTKTQIIVTMNSGAGDYEWRFNRTTGRRVGDHNRWDWCDLEQPTEEALLAIERRETLDRIQSRVARREEMAKLPLETLKQILQLLRTADAA